MLNSLKNSFLKQLIICAYKEANTQMKFGGNVAGVKNTDMMVAATSAVLIGLMLS
jgi:hypothetical protein